MNQQCLPTPSGSLQGLPRRNPLVGLQIGERARLGPIEAEWFLSSLPNGAFRLVIEGGTVTIERVAP